jgi:ABC-type branched-subunit amino acid transport system ATPase component
LSALGVRGLDKSFGGLRVTSSVTLSVEPGERRLIIGPNGAGKTTLFNLITGELRPDRGSITLFDQDITRMPSRRRPHLGIARTYQIITLFAGETLLRNVTLSLLGLMPLRWNPLTQLSRHTALLERAREVLARSIAWCSAVKKGEPIATGKSLFGMIKNSVESPADGASVSPKSVNRGIRLATRLPTRCCCWFRRYICSRWRSLRRGCFTW